MGDTMTKSELKGALFESERTKTKSELIEELSRRFTSFRERDCDLGGNVIIDAIAQALVDGDRIEIRGFGSFGLKYRPERIGRNPQDGSPVSVRPRYTVFFKAGKSLRERVDASKKADD